MKRKPKRGEEPNACDPKVWDSHGRVNVANLNKKDRAKATKLLNDIKATAPKPADIKAIQRIMDEAAKHMHEGQIHNEPPKTPVGTCVVCKGTVRADYDYEAMVDHSHIPIGPSGKDYYTWVFKGYHCEQCGLVYKFAPKPIQ